MAHPPAHTSSTTRNASETAVAFDVSVIIVTYNVREFLAQALDSVADASRGLAVETFVVDNDSADGSAEMVRTQYPDVHLIANEENVGFATANNQAIRRAAGRYLLILNPDTLLQEDTLRELVAYMDAHPRTGAAGCRILNPDGTFAPESRRAFPTPAVAFYRISGLGKLFPNSPRFGRYNLTFLPRDEDCEVDALSGSCMMVRREAVLGKEGLGIGDWGLGTSTATALSDPKTEEARQPVEPPTVFKGTPSAPPTPRPAGLLDENFFMYGEDLDWCYRIQQAGWSIRYTPSTQIVHYKGESTKKGDLRYVMLFYGAMLRFVEKHLAHQPDVGVLERMASRALALALRAGIVVRAGFAALRRLGRHISAPLTDGGLAWGALAAVATAWSLRWEGTFDPAFYGIVLPLYAAVLVLSTGLLGGYRGERRPLRAAWLGAGLAFLVVSTLSFFAPAIAFSRATLLIGYALAALVLTLRRAGSRTNDASPTRTLVVGSSEEARRLQRLLGGHLRPALEIVGYVSDTASSSPKPQETNDAIPHLGPNRQLRDLVRLWDAQEVVFAADSLTNTAILDGMRSLSDRPVRLKILASGRDQVIGKASVEDLSAPLLDAERAVAPLRSTAARRALEIPVALVVLILSPLLRLVTRLGSPARRDHMAAFTSSMRDVLAGRKALVGYHENDPHPPAAWGLHPAAISVLDTLPTPPHAIVDAHRAYWFYARHQSAWLDLEVTLKALSR